MRPFVILNGFLDDPEMEPELAVELAVESYLKGLLRVFLGLFLISLRCLVRRHYLHFHAKNMPRFRKDKL